MLNVFTKSAKLLLVEIGTMTTATLETTTATDWFTKQFEGTLNYKPFPWQVALFERFINGNLPSSCDIPTGLGKTMIIWIWWFALQYNRDNKTAPINKRLVYVVNRRTIVDQATDEATKIAATYPGSIAISTLRGQKADNGEWKKNPDKPAIIVGTPDMVISKLLFGGYGDSKYTRPIHAGIIGNDTLYVVDEAHLSSPLCNTLNDMRTWQNHETIAAPPGYSIKPLNLIELTATPTTISGAQLTLTQDDYDDPIVRQRLSAPKLASFEEVKKEADLCKAICKRASALKNDAAKVIVYINSPATAGKVRDTLTKEHGKDRVALLTGTLRGYERDELIAKDPVVQAFIKNQPVEKTVYLVATSAGEVGWDIDGDHLVCDLTPLDSMIQRLGRVNRKGESEKEPTVHTVYTILPEFKKLSPFQSACGATRKLITKDWKGKSVSPQYLRDWIKTIPPVKYAEAITPPAIPVVVHPHALDAWTLTSIQDPLPYKPPLADYIHGKNDQEPETYLAWRSELGILEQSGITLTKWMSACHLQPQELLRGRATTIRGELIKRIKTHGETKILLIDPDRQIRFIQLKELKELEELGNCTIILPTSFGGLKDGLLDITSFTPVEDVADKGLDRQRKTVFLRQGESTCEVNERPFEAPTTTNGTRRYTIRKLAKKHQMVERHTLQFISGSECALVTFSAKPENDPPTATIKQQPTVDEHNNTMADEVYWLAMDLGMSKPATDTLVWAARQHDVGKADPIWQQAINNHGDIPLAKSGQDGMDVSVLGNQASGYYRHEFGSLVEAVKKTILPGCAAGIDVELALYLIGSHHGHGRPHFRPGAGGPTYFLDPAGYEVPQRFASLQQRYGRWGLAWVHAIFCIADQRAS